MQQVARKASRKPKDQGVDRPGNSLMGHWVRRGEAVHVQRFSRCEARLDDLGCEVLPF